MIVEYEQYRRQNACYGCRFPAERENGSDGNGGSHEKGSDKRNPDYAEDDNPDDAGKDGRNG
jgi:hypothetical protein